MVDIMPVDFLALIISRLAIEKEHIFAWILGILRISPIVGFFFSLYCIFPFYSVGFWGVFKIFSLHFSLFTYSI